jgi:intracellular multiplication protein IcmE
VIDDDIDAPEDFEKEEKPEKPSLKEVWENNPALKLVAIVLAGAVLLGGYMVFFSKGEDGIKSRVQMENAGAKVTPGKEAPDPAYQKALEEQNKKEAELAAKTGQSAIGVPINIPQGQGLNIPEMPEKPKTDVLEEWKKVADAGRMKAAKDEIDEENAPPVPETVPMVQPIRPQQQQIKPDPNAAKRLAEQMRVIVGAQAPPEPKLTVITNEDSPWVAQKKAMEAAKFANGTSANGGLSSASSSTSGASASGGASGSAADQTKTIVPAGTVSYAQLMNELNSDVPGPVLAQVLSGPFAGGRLIGKVKTVEDYMVIEFTTAIKDTVSYKISAVALDEKTTLAGQATSVDNHYFTRLVLPAAAAFLTGYSSSLSQPATSQTATSGVGTQTTSPSATTKQSIYKGIDEASKQVGQLFTQAAQRPITVIIAKGTTMGVFFTDTVTTKDATK